MASKESFEELKEKFITENEKHIAQIKALSFEEFDKDLTQFALADNRFVAMQAESTLYTAIHEKRFSQINADKIPRF